MQKKYIYLSNENKNVLENTISINLYKIISLLLFITYYLFVY